MKIKIKLTLILLILSITSSAYAIPISWSIEGVNSDFFEDFLVSGNYDFDADANSFSNVFVVGAFNNIFISFEGNAQQFGGTSINNNNPITISLAAPMTNAGGSIEFTGFEEDGIGLNAISGTITSDGTPTASVPEPATMTLLGLGLIGLGWTGRKIS